MTTEKKPEAAKPEKKTVTQGDKIAALIKAARENGWSLPPELDDED